MATRDLGMDSGAKIEFTVEGMPAGIYNAESVTRAMVTLITDLMETRGIHATCVPPVQRGSTGVVSIKFALRVVGFISSVIRCVLVLKRKSDALKFAENDFWGTSLTLKLAVPEETSWESVKPALPQLMEMFQACESKLQGAFGSSFYLSGTLLVAGGGNSYVVEIRVRPCAFSGVQMHEFNNYSKNIEPNEYYILARSRLGLFRKPRGVRSPQKIFCGPESPSNAVG